MTIKMSMPFPDMDYWGAFMAMGPAPLGKVSDPPDYGRSPLSTGPYKVESFRPSEELVLVKNDAWVADSDPARHQYADKWIFKFAADPTQTDELMLSGNTESQTAALGQRHRRELRQVQPGPGRPPRAAVGAVHQLLGA